MGLNGTIEDLRLVHNLIKRIDDIEKKLKLPESNQECSKVCDEFIGRNLFKNLKFEEIIVHLKSTYDSYFVLADELRKLG